jgi:eukaryotic-like serine/threonine-protein kinase
VSVADQGSRLSGRYLVGASLGRGASAEVHDGWDELLQRRVAIKVLHPDADSHWSAERFCEEARTAARLSSPHVVTVHDFASDDEPYLVLERMSGRTWADELRDTAHASGGRVDDRRICEVLRAVLHALAEARALGIVHRDVKPGNVMLSEDGVPKLGDFGIAKSAGGDALTRTGEVLGSFAYVAPERASGQSATSASDIWSVGIMAYEAFTGVRPFVGDSTAAVVAAVLRGEHVPIEQLRPDLPATVRQAVTRALSPEPANRPTPEELAAALSGTSTETTATATAVRPVAPAAPRSTPRPEAHAEATASLVTTGGGAVVALPVPWRERAGGRVGLLLGGAAVLVVALVIGVATQATGGRQPSGSTSPAPTVSTPASTAPATTPSAQPVTRTTSSPSARSVKAPAAGAKANPHANPRSTRKGKGHHKPKK